MLRVMVPGMMKPKPQAPPPPVEDDQPVADEPEVQDNLVEEAQEPEEETQESEGVKVPQAIVVYMSGEMGPFQCDHCKYFQDPNACSIVDGEIDPNGLCHVYDPIVEESSEEAPEDEVPAEG